MTRPWDRYEDGERRSMWGGRRNEGRERRRCVRLVKLERRKGERREVADRRTYDENGCWVEVVRKGDSVHGARRKTDKKRRKS